MELAMMPRKLNGGSEQTPDYDVTLKLLNELKTFWLGQQKLAPVDDVRFSQLSVVALTQWAAILGVDVGMAPHQFLAICSAQFKEAYARAPKFSD